MEKEGEILRFAQNDKKFGDGKRFENDNKFGTDKTFWGFFRRFPSAARREAYYSSPEALAAAPCSRAGQMDW